jgi:hypothetical protein
MRGNLLCCRLALEAEAVSNRSSPSRRSRGLVYGRLAITISSLDLASI